MDWKTVNDEGLECKVDSVTPEDIESVTSWVPQLRQIPASFKCAEGLQPDHERTIEQLFMSIAVLSEKVMEAGSKFNWVKWAPQANRYVLDGSLLVDESLETCVRLLITHYRQDYWQGGWGYSHFHEMINCGHIERILTRMESIRKSMSPGSRPIE
jgi:Family of unknown function (DUF6508)